ncbi:GRAM domain-containing protein 1B isoform X1 [Notothenia coriiceps]|uniref:GRAM domain-containing protein 1B isoform X1 n=1 Tax=Notothenia coriiceps TaxID=8208 RepID=A0A6I9MLJ0_9TELE|nr:PREDICTED: GRAM domain-containing protein 1B isoform X1 [Notothenia coriiceps]
MKERKADTDKTSCQKDSNSRQDKRRIKRRTMTPVQTQSVSALDSDWDRDSECEAGGPAQWQQWDWASERVPAVLSPTYKQRNEDFRKLFKQLPDTERLIVDYSCALQRDILLQGRLYLSENWICFYSNIFRWETLLMVRLKDICSMTKEKTARLIPNAIQLCTDNDKHFFSSFGARDRTYMMMFRLWQNALLEKPLCPKELWHFVHQCYGNELGLTSDDEDYVPPDEDFNTMGYCEELPVEENIEQSHDISNNLSKNPEAKPDVSPLVPHRPFPEISPPELPSTEPPAPQCDPAPVEDVSSPLPDADFLTLLLPENLENTAPLQPLDLNENEDLPTELSDSSDTHDEGEVQAFHEDLGGRQFINEVYKFGVDKMYDLLFTESDFMRDFREQRRFSDVVYHTWRTEEDGNQSKEIMYTIALNNPLAPKTATVTETQTLYKASQENECYIIDAEVIAHDVPYHDYFYTLNRYMLTRVAKNRCRLRVSTELRYRKHPWGLVKGFIERNFWSGLNEYFRHLELALSKLDVMLMEPHRQSPKTKALRMCTSRRRKRILVHHLRTPGNMDKALSPVSTPENEEDEDIHLTKHVAGQPFRGHQLICGSTQTRHIPDSPGGFALYNFSKLLLLIGLVISISLVLLVVLNVMLFYKLWMLEYTTQRLAASQALRPDESEAPDTQLEWMQLTDSQQRDDEEDLQKWKEIIRSSVVQLDKIKDSLLHLHKSIGLKDHPPHPESEKRRTQNN